MKIRVYYHDTDALGVVYHANYLKYLEESRTEFLQSKGLNIQEFHKKGVFFAVRKCSISFRSEARYGDILICEAEIKTVKAAQMIFNQKISHKNNGDLITDAEVSLVCLNRDFKPIIIPDDMRTKLI